MIYKLPDLDYDKPLMSNELNQRYKDQASVLVDKMNELIAEVNDIREKLKELHSDI